MPPLFGAWPNVAQAQPERAPACEREGRFDYICGLNNAEDLIQLPGTDWVLAGNMGDRTRAHGGFYIVDAKSRSARPLTPDFTRPLQPSFKDCPAPPDSKLFSAHGISVRDRGERRYTIYAVNHGGRRSVEVFNLDAQPSHPTLVWAGCAVLPDKLAANSVAHLPGEGFVATVFGQPGRPQVGLVLEWSPSAGWSQLPGGEFAGNNGIVSSPDGQWLYVHGYLDGTLNKLSRGRIPYVRQSVQLNMLVDNIRISPKGFLLSTGHVGVPFSAIMACNQSDVLVCPAPTAVAKVDPATLKADLLFVEQHTKSFGGGTSAIVVGDELWIGSFRSQRIAIVPLYRIGSPEL